MNKEAPFFTNVVMYDNMYKGSYNNKICVIIKI